MFNKCCNILNIWEPFIPRKFTKHLKNLKEQSGIKTSKHPASLSCWIRGYKANNHAQLCWIVTAKTQWFCSCPCSWISFVIPIGLFRVHLNLHFKSRLSAKSLLWKSAFIHIEIGTNYHNKNFALRLAFKERLKGTRKWPIRRAEWPLKFSLCIDISQGWFWRLKRSTYTLENIVLF